MDSVRHFVGVFEAVIASRLAPTGVTRTQCGSEPARDRASRYTADFTADGCARIEHNP